MGGRSGGGPKGRRLQGHARCWDPPFAGLEHRELGGAASCAGS